MKIKTYILVFFILFSGFVFGQTYFMNDTLNGKIKSIKFKTFQVNDLNFKIDGINLDLNYHHGYGDGITYTFNFDENGNNIYEEDWNNVFEKIFNNENQLIGILTYTLGNETNRNLRNRTTYTYEKGKVKTTKFYNKFLGTDECLYQEFVNEFDDNMNRTAVITNLYDCGVMKYTTREEYKYNSDNNKTEKKSYNRHTGRSTIVEYIYDTNKNLIKEIQRNGSNDEIEKQTLFEYNKKNNIKSKTEFDKDNNVVRKEVTKYNKNKKIIEKNIYLKDELLSQRFYLYQNNKLIEETYHKKSDLFYKKVFTYDTMGNIIECNYYDDKNIIKRKYELKIEYY